MEPASHRTRTVAAARTGQVRRLRCRHQLPQDAWPQRHLAPLLLLPQPRPGPSGGTEHRCPERNIRSEALDAFVFDQLREVLLRPDLLLTGERSLATLTPATDDELLEAELARLTRRHDATDAEHRRLLDLYQAGLIDLTELQRRNTEVEHRRRDLTQRREALTSQRQELARDNHMRRRVHDFAAGVRTGIDNLNFAQKQTLLRLLIEEVRVTGWQVEIQLRIPLDEPPQSPRPSGHRPPPPDGANPTVSTEDRLRSVGVDQGRLLPTQ